MDIAGGITRTSKFSVPETMEKLASFLEQHGAKIYARINQQTELEHVGIRIQPLEYLLFGNPAKGGAIIAANPMAALDLPLKIIVREAAGGETMVSYHDKSLIARRYNVPPEMLGALDLNPLVSAAFGAE